MNRKISPYISRYLHAMIATKALHVELTKILICHSVICFESIQKLIKNLAVVVFKDSLETNNGNAIRKDPNEVTFFKGLHAEFEKVSSFFAKAEKELKIKFDRNKVGREIFVHSDSKMVQDKWTLYGRSVYNLHNSLLLLETYAIMNYCAFSKILKKHDKKTGYNTKMAFMKNVVNRSNFATYPHVLAMIRESEALYDQVSQKFACEENHDLREDEQLFIGMVHKINTGTKGDDALIKRSCFQERTDVVSPIKTVPTITETQIAMKSLLQDLLKTKRFRTVSEHSISSDSSIFDGENELKDDNDVAAPNRNNRKHHFTLTTCQHSKKHRRR